MSESKLQTKLQNKAQNKANKLKHKNREFAESGRGRRGKSKDAAANEESAPNPLQNFAILSQHITDKRSVMALDSIAQLDFKSKVQLISEISQYVIMSPEINVIFLC